ncbi:UNVERIFIED_CONTAM: hypothetical protein Sradi_1590200 [Sesamum radiatum]|uniref:F-box domain-containing protein n=1 Tax=Sesamum radiatum TaxID=300843 RepID=A0AAW2UAG8_SESRA
MPLHNDDILNEILSYLPVKSLLRFKTVRKSWHDIIVSWAFMKQHLQNYCNNCSNNNGILVRVYDGYQKVVQLFIFNSGGKPSVEVYSQSTNTWKELDHELPNDMYVKNAIMPYKNGSLSFSHWLAFKQLRRRNGANYSILSFNVQNEVFERTPLPPCVHDAAYESKVKLRFLAEDDSLLLFVYPFRRQYSPGDVCFERWVLTGLGDEGRWTRLASISILPVEVPKPLVVWKNSALVWEDSGKKNKLVFYNYCTQEVTNAIVIPPKQCALKVLGYKGSLISPAIFMKAQL